jgi:hypothetical protein
MDENQIRNKMRSYSQFRGVFARNEFREALHKCRNLDTESAFIINTDPESKPGEHWLAVYYTPYKQFNFFDSYGLSPNTYGFSNDVFSEYNKRCVQALESDTCGQHCIYYLINRFKGSKDPYSAFPMSTPVSGLDSFVRSFVDTLPRFADEIQSQRHQRSNTFTHYRNYLRANGIVY